MESIINCYTEAHIILKVIVSVWTDWNKDKVAFWIFVNDGHSDWCKVVSPCGFNLYLSGD